MVITRPDTSLSRRGVGGVGEGVAVPCRDPKRCATCACRATRADLLCVTGWEIRVFCARSAPRVGGVTGCRRRQRPAPVLQGQGVEAEAGGGRRSGAEAVPRRITRSAGDASAAPSRPAGICKVAQFGVMCRRPGRPGRRAAALNALRYATPLPAWECRALPPLPALRLADSLTAPRWRCDAVGVGRAPPTPACDLSR